MSKFSRWRKIPPIVNAAKWEKNGDHPLDGRETLLVTALDGRETSVPAEGKVVRYFRHPKVKGSDICRVCGHQAFDHGWIDNPLGADWKTTVCPGDWIISHPNGFEAVNPADFLRNYEKAS